MKISIVTVCLNAAHCIENAVQSVLSQTYEDIEYIIIDGNSHDKTLDVVNKYRDRISKIVSEKDNGIYDAMNKGIKIAKGDVLYFLNSDDKLYDEDVVSNIVKIFLQNPDAGIVYGNVKQISLYEGAKVIKHPITISKKEDFLKQSIFHQSIFTKKWVFEEVGVFHPAYKIYADYDWLLRAFSRSIKMVFVNRNIAFYDLQGMSYKNFKQAKKEKFNIIYKNFSFIVYVQFLLRHYLWISLNYRRHKLIIAIKHFCRGR